MYTCYLLLVNGKKFDFLKLNILLAENFAWNTKFLFFREIEEKAHITMFNCSRWQRRKFQDPVNLECRKTKPHFLPNISKIVSEFLLLHAAIMRVFELHVNI